MVGVSAMASDDVTRRVRNRYTLRRQLGSGGGGTVWAGDDELLQRPVAVKAVDIPDSVPDEEHTASRERVLREARAAARLEHPNVVTVFDVFDEDGCAYIVMELVGAPSLAALVARDGPLEPSHAAEIGLQLLDALEAAHGHGVVHRDVKPSNVVVPDAGSAKLTDFGIATLAGDSRVTASGVVLGSPSYIAPEQAREGTGQSAADLWGLGATLYFAVEGEPPFERAQPVATVEAVLHAEPRPAERAGALEPLLADLLHKDPAARPSHTEVRERLRALASGEASGVAATQPAEVTQPIDTAPPVEEPPPDDRPGEPAPPRTAAGPPWWRRPAVAFGAVALLLLAAVAGAAALRGGGQEEVAEAPSGGDAAEETAPGEESPADKPSADDDASAGEQAADEQEPPSAEQHTPDAAGRVPDDWVAYRHDLGWSIAHPPGWDVVAQEGNMVDFRDPQSSTYLRVDYTDDPPASAVQAWEELSASFAESHADYRELGIEPTTFKGFDGALWEYRYREGGVRLRAANLGFGTDEFGQALNFQTTADVWQASQDVHEAFRASFQPASDR